MTRPNRRQQRRGQGHRRAQDDVAFFSGIPAGVSTGAMGERDANAQTSSTVRTAHAEGRVMALDVGGRRIGVAISDETWLIATPLQFVERGPHDRSAFRSLIEAWDIGRIVAGLPTGLSGREGPQAADVRAYANALAVDLDVPLDYWDERLTTAIAEKSLIASGRSRADRRERIDSVAAAIILQSFLDNQRFRARRCASDQDENAS